MATKANLVIVAKEMNKVLELNPPIKLNMTVPNTETKVKEAIVLIEQRDKLSTECLNIIEEYGYLDEKSKKWIIGGRPADAPVNKPKAEVAAEVAAEVETIVEKAETAAEEPATETDEKPKAVASGGKSLAAMIDDLVTAGGEFTTICTTMNEAATARGSKMKFTAGSIRAHINFRLKKDAKYLGKLKITDTGIA